MKNFTWRPMDDQFAQARLEKVLLSWAGTPYVAGARKKKKGVDCVRFVVAVLDELSGKQTEAENITPDTAVHNPQVAVRALARLIARFDCTEVLDEVLEPGDVIAMGPEGCGPGHAVIVGTRPRVCWEASGTQVRKISLGLQAVCGQDVFAVYRLNNRDWR